jgi:hypothetical protein
MVNSREAVCPKLSLTLGVNVNVPGTVGLPVFRKRRPGNTQRRERLQPDSPPRLNQVQHLLPRLLISVVALLETRWFESWCRPEKLRRSAGR